MSSLWPPAAAVEEEEPVDMGVMETMGAWWLSRWDTPAVCTMNTYTLGTLYACVSPAYNTHVMYM